MQKTKEGYHINHNTKLIHSLRQAVEYAYVHTRFYHNEAYKTLPRSIEEFQTLPLCDATTLSSQLNNEFHAIAARDIERIVTLQSSGSTSARPKRIALSKPDLLATIDYFCIGMASMIAPESGQRVLILLPGASEYGIVHLLSIAIEQLHCRPIHVGIPATPAEGVELLEHVNPHCIVGLPHQILAICELAATLDTIPTALQSILLSADYLPPSIARRITKLTGATVRNHYGSTEMGYGGALECSMAQGLHLRDGFYAEIIDPLSGKNVPSGSHGELVITTLTERATPLIRYRSGDLAFLNSDPCPCGQSSPRLISPMRLEWAKTPLNHLGNLVAAQLDELIFNIDGVVDYRISAKELTLFTPYGAKVSTDQIAAVKQSLTSTSLNFANIATHSANQDFSLNPSNSSENIAAFEYLQKIPWNLRKLDSSRWQLQKRCLLHNLYEQL